MLDLTARQIQILRAIIEEFIDSADAVGSETIDKKYSIGVSPATIRNEMVELTRRGYLQKSHTSSGRLPTSMAMKLYVNELMRERELTVADEVSAKEKIWKNRTETHGMLQEVARVMADKSHAIGVAVFDHDTIYTAGYANLMDMPEFADVSVTHQVLQLIEEVRVLEEIFERSTSENQVQVVYGQDLGNKYLAPVGFIHMQVPLGNHSCRVGVLGSSRFDYSYVIPMMKYVRQLLLELAG